MTQLRLAYSNQRINDSGKPSNKLRMSQASLRKLPPLASKVIRLQAVDPAMGIVIERLVDDALKRRAG